MNSFQPRSCSNPYSLGITIFMTVLLYYWLLHRFKWNPSAVHQWKHADTLLLLISINKLKISWKSGALIMVTITLTLNLVETAYLPLYILMHCTKFNILLFFKCTYDTLRVRAYHWRKGWTKPFQGIQKIQIPLTIMGQELGQSSISLSSTNPRNTDSDNKSFEYSWCQIRVRP